MFRMPNSDPGTRFYASVALAQNCRVHLALVKIPQFSPLWESSQFPYLLTMMLIGYWTGIQVMFRLSSRVSFASLLLEDRLSKKCQGHPIYFSTYLPRNYPAVCVLTALSLPGTRGIKAHHDLALYYHLCLSLWSIYSYNVQKPVSFIKGPSCYNIHPI